MTTPQPLAQEVASRAAVMAQRTGQRLVGVVENMTGEAFGAGGGELLARRARDAVPRLGSARCRSCASPATAASPWSSRGPDSASARALVAIAELVAAARPGAIQKPLTLLT